MNSQTELRSQIVRVILTGGALLAALAAAPSPAAAAGLTFVVNKNTDAPDLHPGDGKCDTSNKSGKQCTLRAAIQEANASGGSNVIAFGLASTAVTIAPSSALPAVTDDGITINGYSQSGATPNTVAVGDNAKLKVVLDGINVGGITIGLDIEADHATVKGLTISRFSGSGITVTGSAVLIAGNFVGTNAKGTLRRGNDYGVEVLGVGDVIGGSSAASRNLVSGNGNDGIHIDDTVQPPTNTIVENNYVGTTANGMAALGNGNAGVLLTNGSNSTIGVAGAGNLIADNGRAGISISTGSGYQVAGNLIGTKADKTGDLGNVGTGIGLSHVSSSFVGGNPHDGNLIVGNGGPGVTLGVGAIDVDVSNNIVRANDGPGITAVGSSFDTIVGNTVQSNGGDGVSIQKLAHVADATGDRISHNQISNNGRLGINLVDPGDAASGVTFNDIDDGDSGSNDLQNFPHISSAVASSSNKNVVVSGTLNSVKDESYEIEVFVSAVDPTGNGEGQTWEGSTVLTLPSTATTGSWVITIQVHVAPGSRVTATATNEDTNSTSEFSPNATVTGT